MDTVHRHPYAVIATLIGAYLGVLWHAAGNLLAPITTHAFYDFVAPVYFLRGNDTRRRERLEDIPWSSRQLVKRTSYATVGLCAGQSAGNALSELRVTDVRKLRHGSLRVLHVFKRSRNTLQDLAWLDRAALGSPTTEERLLALFPDLNVTEDQFIEYCVNPALRMRQQIRDELSKIDPEYAWVSIRSPKPDDFQLLTDQNAPAFSRAILMN